jgi:hypothetical protein
MTATSGRPAATSASPSRRPRRTTRSQRPSATRSTARRCRPCCGCRPLVRRDRQRHGRPFEQDRAVRQCLRRHPGAGFGASGAGRHRCGHGYGGRRRSAASSDSWRGRHAGGRGEPDRRRRLGRLFSGGGPVLGLDSGIVLTTGDVRHMLGPTRGRTAAWPRAAATPIWMRPWASQTTDTTALEFQFSLTQAGTLYLDYVFASDEYNAIGVAAGCVCDPGQAAGQQHLDQLCAGSGHEPARYRRRPSTAPPTRPYYNNNDPADAGRYQREFGYNGFTDVFQVAIPNLAAGIHQIKFAISDVGDLDGTAPCSSGPAVSPRNPPSGLRASSASSTTGSGTATCSAIRGRR